jgi:hypothetical protein
LNLIFIEKAIKIPYLKTLHTSILIISLFFCITISAQDAIIQGVILNEKNEPVEGVNVKYTDGATTTNRNGYYRLNVPANRKITITFTHINLKQARQVIELSPNESFEFNIVLKENEEQLSEIVINSRTRKRMEGIVTIDPAVIRKIPGANAGVENILKSFAGVNSNNELSTQYAVRGGNYDENLVYVNEIEIYRPFLIRSGQQEGLSFTNTDLVQNVDFSAGGFQAKYGDKLSSVLDITYRIPKTFGAVAEASFLGGSIAVDAVSKNGKWTSITGIRYRDNSLFVNSQDVETNFRPVFADVQTYTTFTPSAKWQWSFLGNISQNRYNYEPTSRQTNFGTIDSPIALVVDYEGQEKDKYTTYFGALKSDFRVSDAFMLKFIGSAYHTQEQEYFDIVSNYGFGELDTNLGSESFGQVGYVTNIGTEINHARNNLDALIVNAEVKGVHTLAANTIEWGFKFTRENIRDRIVEWQVIDSAGFSIDPPLFDSPDYQPEVPNVGPLVPFQYVRATNFVTINRWSGYAQWLRKDNIGPHEITYNFGIRAHQWKVSPDDQEGKNQMTFSPRAQVAIKPDWEKDMVFRFSTGLYHQPPFYRELRDASGAVRTNVKAQQSIHFVLSNDYSFKMWERPFKLVSELYYKSLSDVNTYTIDNVRIRYAANNDAKAYAQGLDIRMNGEFVPGTESWLSFGYMKTEENSNNRGYIARPTDQRLKFGILFQDFMPRIPSVKLYLNLVYNTGLPGGSPAYADPYVFQSRLRDYRRADVGFSYILTENNFKRQDTHWLKKFKDLSVGFEIFNIFNNQNAITNTWVRDTYSKFQYGVPNYLTTRVFNVKVSTKF